MNSTFLCSVLGGEQNCLYLCTKQIIEMNIQLCLFFSLRVFFLCAGGLFILFSTLSTIILSLSHAKLSLSAGYVLPLQNIEEYVK